MFPASWLAVLLFCTSGAPSVCRFAGYGAVVSFSLAAHSTAESDMIEIP
jgi:hypothetical protein